MTDNKKEYRKNRKTDNQMYFNSLCWSSSKAEKMHMGFLFKRISTKCASFLEKQKYFRSLKLFFFKYHSMLSINAITTADLDLRRRKHPDILIL